MDDIKDSLLLYFLRVEKVYFVVSVGFLVSDKENKKNLKRRREWFFILRR